MKQITANEEEEYKWVKYTAPKYGKGHPKSGRRRNVPRSIYFQTNLLRYFATTLGEKKFKVKYCGLTPHQVAKLFDKIKVYYMTDEETYEHALNKLLLWLDRMHNSLSYAQISEQYDIGASTALGFIKEIPCAIVKAYSTTNIVSFPDKPQRHKMVEILKQKDAPLPDAVFVIDGSHLRCNGKSKKHFKRLSWKHKYSACFNVTFVTERVLGTVCAFNLSESAKTHDTEMLRSALFYNNIDSIMDGWIIIADKGYVNDINIAASVKKNDKRRKLYPKDFWRLICAARADAERSFSHMFNNKFKFLRQWTGTARDTYAQWATCVTACIIVFNALKLDMFD